MGVRYDASSVNPVLIVIAAVTTVMGTFTAQAVAKCSATGASFYTYSVPFGVYGAPSATVVNASDGILWLRSAEARSWVVQGALTTDETPAVWGFGIAAADRVEPVVRHDRHIWRDDQYWFAGRPGNGVDALVDHRRSG